MKRATGINHIGVAVTSIADQMAFYRDVLGLEYEGEETVTDQKVRVAFFRCGAVRIELLEPTVPDSPIARFIEKRGQGLHHLAYGVEDLPARIEELQSRGIKMIDERPRPGAHGMGIAFIHPKSSHGVLTELCEALPTD
ncbi:MAG: methylmalonyl-CoA epimerase [Acidobacteria bacterium]|nr:MAG: methylmalonyl-CoA epimerase [Acidobacteriota bacterium]